MLASACSHPGYFGKIGMRYFHKKGNLYFCPTVNVGNLWPLVGEDVRKEHAAKTDKAPVIDVTKFVSSVESLGGYGRRCAWAVGKVTRTDSWLASLWQLAVLTDKALTHRVILRCWARVCCPANP
eukprot:COSAG01_NODE_558_length_15478_cov_217.596788_13_plen_125_part_00